MNANVLIDNIKTAIRINAELEIWCRVNYGKSVKIFTGLDRRNLPKAVDYPLVVLQHIGKSGGPGGEMEAFDVAVICGINDDGMTTDVDGNKTANGELNQESMRQLVLAAIGTADMDGGHIEDWATSVDVEDQYPIFVISTTVHIVRPYGFRDNNYE
jgi:hypothetical protein